MGSVPHAHSLFVFVFFTVSALFDSAGSLVILIALNCRPDVHDFVRIKHLLASGQAALPFLNGVKHEVVLPHGSFGELPDCPHVATEVLCGAAIGTPAVGDMVKDDALDAGSEITDLESVGVTAVQHAAHVVVATPRHVAETVGGNTQGEADGHQGIKDGGKLDE